MKKTLITLLALCGVAAAAEFTSDSYIEAKGKASWDAEGKDQSKLGLYSSCVGISSVADVNDDFTSYINGALQTSQSPIFSIKNEATNELVSKSITLSSMYNKDKLDTQVALVSYSFITRKDGVLTNDVKVKISDSTGTVLGYSEVVSYDTNAKSTTNEIYGVGTFTFSDTIVINSNEAYTYSLVNDNDELTAYTSTFNYARFRTYFGSNNGYWINNQHNNGDYAVYSIVTKSIPEPTTATLSLLALAGLAARRRRATR